MVQKLLQVRAHLILCFRAEEKIEMVKKDGKVEIVPKQGPTGLNGWMPVCEKNLPFELTASFLLTADAPGVPKPIKLQQQHRVLFPLDAPITEESGKRIAEWAAGGGTNWKRELDMASTLDELATVWKRIPKADQASYAAAKDARKIAIETPATVEEPI